jgi:hypothetical protein
MHSTRSPIKNWRDLGLRACAVWPPARQSVVDRWVRRVRQCKKSAKDGCSVTITLLETISKEPGSNGIKCTVLEFCSIVIISSARYIATRFGDMCGLLIFYLSYEQSSKLTVGLAVLVNTHTHTHTTWYTCVCPRIRVSAGATSGACIDLGKYIMPNNLQWRLTLSSATLDLNLEITYSLCILSQCRDSRSLLLHHFRLCIIKRNFSLNYKKALCLLIPDRVIGIFHWHNPSDRTMALGSIQPLTEMSTRSISWG